MRPFPGTLRTGGMSDVQESKEGIFRIIAEDFL